MLGTHAGATGHDHLLPHMTTAIGVVATVTVLGVLAALVRLTLMGRRRVADGRRSAGAAPASDWKAIEPEACCR